MFRTSTSTRRNPVVRIVGAALIAAAATVAVAAPAQASTAEVVPTAQAAAVYHWGAWSVSPSTGRTAYAYDYPSKSAAISAANKRCGLRDCRNLVWVANGCAAVAQAPNGSIGGGAAATLAEAKRLAVTGSGSSKARVYGWFCTTGHR